MSCKIYPLIRGLVVNVADGIGIYATGVSSGGMAINGAEGADHDEVRLRLEIMMSQIELLQQGDLAALLIKKEQRKAVVATLIRNLLHLLDKQVDTMTPAQVKAILPVLSELDGP